MRKRLLLVLSVAMLVSGLYLLAAELLWVDQRQGLIVLLGLMFVGFGAYLLWTDFVAPVLGIKTKQ
jgi:hypothetical protein